MTTPEQAARDVADAVAAVARHYRDVILPAWREAGFDREMGLPFEALDAQGQALPAQRYRAMACARQAYVFAQAGDQAHAERLLASLAERFRDSESGGWFYSIDANGAPLDTSKDLYTHAFIVFASAELLRRFGTPQASALLLDTLQIVDDRFGTTDGSGLLNASLDRHFARALSGPLQNPLMHLVEACLSARDALPARDFDARLEHLGDAVRRHFVDSRTGCVLELPREAADNRVEPGHQFEWYFLVHGAGKPWAPRALAKDIGRAYRHAVQHGIEPRNLGVRAALNADGGVREAGQRIWAQTEYLRALALHEGATPTLARALHAFREHFLRPVGWIESRAADGTIERDDMPSTTPYHLCTALAGLHAGTQA
ncbi:AGE family epimerase/isomerase [Chitinasiproducens palmae]|uniref:Mannose-6-phosphate isomerase n=1 Tax=Chitinasiproducens palmae TaxID=1770053 RepID=A0A1H2PMV6_9BURK|nr:AGE family epimerase/isomerase [Chitinasiproducens palmae]SDV47821.1 mannose-6-phosphate isomerase [Chitinasiproducens palmae]